MWERKNVFNNLLIVIPSSWLGKALCKMGLVDVARNSWCAMLQKRSLQLSLVGPVTFDKLYGMFIFLFFDLYLFVCFILILVYLYFSSSVSFSICGYSFWKWNSLNFCKEKDNIKKERLNEYVYDLIVSFLIALWLCCTQAYARDQIYDEYTQNDIWKRDNIFFFIWE